MAKEKVRCLECGAKNADDLAERCRICGGLLPDVVRRRADRLGAITAGPAFNVLVENEVDAWRELERREDEGPRSRRPTEDEASANKGRWGWRRTR
jgi:hypothetical protein